MINTAQNCLKVGNINHNWEKLAGLFLVKSKKMGKNTAWSSFYSHTSWNIHSSISVTLSSFMETLLSRCCFYRVHSGGLGPAGVQLCEDLTPHLPAQVKWQF